MHNAVWGGETLRWAKSPAGELFLECVECAFLRCWEEVTAPLLASTHFHWFGCISRTQVLFWNTQWIPLALNHWQRTAHRFLKLGFQSRATFYPHFIWMSSIFVLFILFLKNEVERVISSWWKLFNHEQDSILSMGNTQVNKARPFSSRLVIQQIDSR